VAAATVMKTAMMTVAMTMMKMKATAAAAKQ
jgi:hypothetical protein